jgi:uncharacterized protein YcbK (DUF882 family)
MSNSREPDWDVYPNFSREEFVCSCGCGQALMRSETIAMAQTLRTQLGEPLHVTSGYRCSEYNQRVSSTGPNGPHVLGLAVDFGVYGDKAHRLLTAALSNGVPRVGVKQVGPHKGRFIHLDLITSDLSPWLWSY